MILNRKQSHIKHCNTRWNVGNMQTALQTLQWWKTISLLTVAKSLPQAHSANLTLLSVYINVSVFIEFLRRLGSHSPIDTRSALGILIILTGKNNYSTMTKVNKIHNFCYYRFAPTFLISIHCNKRDTSWHSWDSDISLYIPMSICRNS